MTSPSSRAVGFDRIATDLFGEDWIQPMARLIDLSPRTLQRIRAAAKAQEEFPAARGASAALAEALPPLTARAAALAKGEQ